LSKDVKGVVGDVIYGFCEFDEEVIQFFDVRNQKDADYKTYSMLRGMIELRIFIFGCSNAGNSSKAMFYILILL
jgi:hypothetical protein